jgi:putative membrane protein
LNYWSLPISLAVFLVLVTLFYVRGWLRLRSERPDTTSPWRIAGFGGGFLVLLIATGSPLAVLDHELLSIHMVQHILLMSVAPALLLLGAPVLTLAHGLPTRLVRGLAGPFLRWAPVRAVGRILFHPIFCWSIASAAVIGWHVPALFELTVRSHGWHEIQQVTFFVAGVLFWWPVIPPWPSVSGRTGWSVPLYLFLATLPCDALSAFLAFADRVVYQPYILAAHSFRISPLEDQQWAGVLMWVCITFIYMVPAMIITVRILSPAENRTSESGIIRPAVDVHPRAIADSASG